ncbi:YjcQ family protein [Mogibacterium timidum]
MNTLEAAYKILKNLESAKDVEYMGTLISPEHLNVSDEEWLMVMKNLLEEGYIRGVDISKNVLGETKKGAQYLHENSAMQKFMRIATNVITIGSSIK